MTLSQTIDFSVADFRRRVADRSGLPRKLSGDHSLNPDIKDMILSRKLRDAAVLIALVERDQQPYVIMTQRNANLRSHSGQVAFPGGRIDPEDGSPEIAALRETHEEIGLPPEQFDVIGRMPDYATGSGFLVAPVLAVALRETKYRINPAEVEDAFEVPLEFLMNPSNHRRGSRIWEGRERFYWMMPYGDRQIWGVTAGIIRALYERYYI